MKKNIIILITSILSSQFSFSQNWQWAKQLNGVGIFNNEGLRSLLSDGTNFYAIGSYDNVLYLSTDTLNSSGLNDIFIIKYDNGGNLLWAKTLGGGFNQPSDGEDAWGVFDAANNCIYIAGHFIDVINFGGTISLTSYSGSSDIFLAKMDLSGNFVWAVKGGGWGYDRARIFLSPSNKIYLVAQTSDSAYFDSYHLGPGGGLIQYDLNGNCLSAEIKFTANVFSNQNEVYLDFINNDLILYGTIRSATFQLDTSILNNSGASDAFIARANDMGNLQWIKKFGNGGLDFIPYKGLSMDNSNNMYVTGGFKDSINLGGPTLYNTNQDIMLAKFDANGNIIWNRQMFANGSASQGGGSLLSDGDGNCYVTGLFSGNVSFGTFNLSTTNAYDMFLARYDTNGDCLGVRNFGIANGRCVVTDSNGDVLNGGIFESTINVAGNSFTASGYDIYLAKIDAITGIGGENRTANNQLIIYANPTTGKSSITVPDDFVNEKNLTLSIYDNTGKLIQQKTLEMNNGKIKLNLEEEAKGVYNVSLNNKKKSYNGKIIFE